MDFRFTPEEQDFRMSVRQFVKDEIPDIIKGVEEIHSSHIELEMEDCGQGLAGRCLSQKVWRTR